MELNKLSRIVLYHIRIVTDFGKVRMQNFWTTVYRREPDNKGNPEKLIESRENGPHTDTRDVSLSQSEISA